MNNTESMINLHRLKELHEKIYGEDERINKAVAIAYEAIHKAERYKFHDLRKNPEDLPYCNNNEDYDVFIYDKYGWCVGKYDHECKKWYETMEYRELHNVIAWRNIEPFEEGKV